MKFLEKRPAGKDQDIEIPVFMANKAELKILYALLRKGKTYIPDLLMPDMARLRNMHKVIGDYLGIGQKKRERKSGSGMVE